jgi:histidinol dehydrogenase
MLPSDLRAAMRLAKSRIEAFHKRQKHDSWEMEDKEGFRLAQRWMPMASAGLYIPGGRAAYPSSVLMNAIPAQVAGVQRIVAITPPQAEWTRNRGILGALHLCGITEVFLSGGAQGIAALAWGTETVPRVDKVVGPGNAYVAEAKRQLYGRISIDSLAGPTDVMIIADSSAPAAWIAADMIAQAEHDPEAQSIAVLIGRRDAPTIAAELHRQTQAAHRRMILEQSLARWGAIIEVTNEQAAIEIANRKAPEHLEILTTANTARTIADAVRHAGSIFVGKYAVEAIGDYMAGPNHVLPTGGTARSFSPLSVQDFLRMTQIIECGRQSIEAVGEAAALFADSEDLAGHAASIRIRLLKTPPKLEPPPKEPPPPPPAKPGAKPPTKGPAPKAAAAKAAVPKGKAPAVKPPAPAKKSPQAKPAPVAKKPAAKAPAKQKRRPPPPNPRPRSRPPRRRPPRRPPSRSLPPKRPPSGNRWRRRSNRPRRPKELGHRAQDQPKLRRPSASTMWHSRPRLCSVPSG